MSISELFPRNNYFTKNQNKNDSIQNNNNIFPGRNNSENKSNLEKNIKLNNKRNHSYNSTNNEIELYFAMVETIIPVDEKINKKAIYNIKITSSLNYNDHWVKSYTLDDLIKFRNYLLKYASKVINLPFPQKSIFRFLPYIGQKYDERNWDVLLENKFYLDDFFETICKDREMYKLAEFINFFSKP